MLIPEDVDVPMERVPVMNWIVIGLTTLVSLVILVEPPEVAIRYLVLQRGGDFHLAQLAGYTLVHADPSDSGPQIVVSVVHLLGNMIFLFCFGNAINAKLGHATFLVFYVATGTLAGLAWLMFGGGGGLIGASGAIMGVVGAFFILYPRNDVSVSYFLVFRWGTFRCPSAGIILCYLAFDVLGLVAAGASHVAYIAHVVGMLAGIVVAVVLLLSGRIESTRYEQNLLEILKIQR